MFSQHCTSSNLARSAGSCDKIAAIPAVTPGCVPGCSILLAYYESIITICCCVACAEMAKAQRAPCLDPPNSTIVSGATWFNCANMQDGGTCTGTCGSADNGRSLPPYVSCTNGVWSYSFGTTVNWCKTGEWQTFSTKYAWLRLTFQNSLPSWHW